MDVWNDGRMGTFLTDQYEFVFNRHKRTLRTTGRRLSNNPAVAYLVKGLSAEKVKKKSLN